MTLIPFYVISDIMIDGYFMDKLSHKEDRILLIRGKRESKKVGEIKPIPFSVVISLLREGYDELNKQEYTREMKISEVLESIFYNQSIFMKNRQKELTEKVMRKIFTKMYENLFKKIRDNYDKVVWLQVEVRQNEVFLENKNDEVYTRFFKFDEVFRTELMKLYTK